MLRSAATTQISIGGMVWVDCSEASITHYTASTKE